MSGGLSLVCLRSVLLCGILSFGCGASDDAKDNPLDPSFDNWCDQHLCDWFSEGVIESTGTWHEQDLAVSFLSNPTRISQNLKLKGESARCILFDTIADVASDAEVSLELDFNSDRIVDRKQQIVGVRWKSVPFVINTPVAYDGLTLSLVKRGTGRAVLAQMRVVPQRNCPGGPLTLADRSFCSQNEVCSSGLCADGACQPCLSGDCTSFTPSASSE